MATYNFKSNGEILVDGSLYRLIDGPAAFIPNENGTFYVRYLYGSDYFYYSIGTYSGHIYQIDGDTFEGTLSEFCDAAQALYESESTGGGSSSAYTTVSTTLTDAQIRAVIQTPVQVMDAPEAGTLNIVVSIMIVQNFTVAYDAPDAGDEDYLNFRYGQTEPNDADIAYIANGAQPTLNSFLTSTGERVSILPVQNMRNDASWNIVSRTISFPIACYQAGLWIGGGNIGHTFTGGDAANTMKVIVGYYTVSI